MKDPKNTPISVKTKVVSSVGKSTHNLVIFVTADRQSGNLPLGTERDIREL